MTPQEAFAILGLAESSSESSVQEAYLRLAKEWHPDAGGDEAHMKDLNNARDVALASLARGALVPISTVLDVIRTTERSRELRLENQERTKRTVRYIISHHANPLRQYKRRATFLASLSGFLAVATSKSLDLLDKIPILFSPTTKELLQSPLLTSVCAISAAVVGAYAWAYSAKASRLEEMTEEVNELLSDKEQFLRLLHEAVHSWCKNEHEEPAEILCGSVTSDQVESMLARLFRVAEVPHRHYRWEYSSRSLLNQYLRRAKTLSQLVLLPISVLFQDSGVYRLVHEVGIHDFAKLFTAKGIELGELKEIETQGHMLDTAYEIVRYHAD